MFEERYFEGGRHDFDGFDRWQVDNPKHDPSKAPLLPLLPKSDSTVIEIEM